MLCIRSDRPLDPLTAAVIRDVDAPARALEVPYFVAGAMARDILLTHVFGIATGVGTRDVDFAVAVGSWDHFNEIKTKLVATSRFVADARRAHRLYYRTVAGTQGYPLDLIPFDGPEDTQHILKWPPEYAEEMNVIGYREAMHAAAPVELEPGFAVRVASLAGLGLLKLFAWSDRGNTDPKDARDLMLLMSQYARAGNEDRLYGAEFDLLRKVDHVHDFASARLLARDVRRMAAPATLEMMLALLHDQGRADRLVTDMAASLKDHEYGADVAQRLLQQFIDELDEN